MFAGFDFGTSGARTIVVDDNSQVQFEAKVSYDIQDESTWQTALFSLISQIPAQIRQILQVIAIDGTSGTFVGCDGEGRIMVPPQLYNDPGGKSALSFLREVCPDRDVVLSSTSTLARLVNLQQRGEWQANWYLVHHADRVAYFLHHRLDITDWHNALKLGYDPIGLCYPPAIVNLGFKLPLVVAPGTILGQIDSLVAQEWGINPGCHICSGTTDSNSAFLAAVGYEFEPGVAVTSLGSTLTVKVMSQKPIFAQEYGIYSHRWEDFWLVGGASNTGGRVLSHFFTSAQITALSQTINPAISTNLDYYPLLEPGERFPVCDPELQPRLTPRPPEDYLFLQGLLEAIARIEREGYDRLADLGADPPSVLYTLGGGATNPHWTAIRQNYLRVPFAHPKHREAAYGTALLALRSLQKL